MAFRKHPFRWALLALLLAWPLARFVSVGTAWLDYPFHRHRTEGLTLYESQMFKRGDNVYAPITPDRFVSGPHPPIYYWLTSATLPSELPDLTDPDNVPSIFESSRLLSMLAAVVTAALVPLFVVVERGSGRRRHSLWYAALGGVIGGVLFLYAPPVLVWATQMGGELPALAFTLAGLACVAAGARALRGQGAGEQVAVDDSHSVDQHQTEGHPLGRREASRVGSYLLLLLSAVLFGLAFFTTLSLAGPLAAAAYLLARNRKVGLAWLGVMAGLIAVPFAVLSSTTDHWSYRHMFEYHPWLNRVGLLDLLSALWEDHWPLLLLAGVYIFYVLRQFRARGRGGSTRAVLPLSLFFLAATLLSLPFGPSLGVDHNRLLLPVLALCVSVGVLLASLLTHVSNEGAAPWLPGWTVPTVAGLLVVYAVITSWPSSWYNRDLAQLSDNQMAQMRQIIFNLKQDPGKSYLSDDPGLLALAGKETPYNDLRSMTAMALQGRWDEAAYRDALTQSKFSLLVLSCDAGTESPDGSEPESNCPSDSFTPGVLDAIRSGYKVLFWDIFSTYVPK